MSAARRLFVATVCALAGGLVFASASALAAEPPEAPAPAVVESVTANSAVFRGELNPGKTGPAGTFELDTYEFLYSQGSSCEGGSRVPEPAGISLGGGEEALPSQAVSGLRPDTEYTVCLLSSNSVGVPALGLPVTFMTALAAPTVASESVSAVESTAVSFEAQVDPDGLETTYRFEYGTSESYGQSTSESASIGEDNLDHTVTARITGLQPGSTYHYRVVASNSLSPAGGTLGPDKTFTTNAAPGSAPVGSCPNEQLRAEQPYGLELPDCRAYEMVSPVETNGQDATDSFINSGPRASVSGEAITYASLGSFGVAAGSSFENQYLSRRGPDGWSTQSLTPPQEAYRTVALPVYQQTVFTPELSEGVAFTSAVVLSGEPGQALYLADFASDSYRYVTPVVNEGHDELMGTSTDLSHIVFEGSEWVDGKVIPVTVTNNGEELGEVGSAQYLVGLADKMDLWHAVSANGSRVYFTNPSYIRYVGEVGNPPLLTYGRVLYVRVNAEQPQSALGASGECVEPAKACTVEVSASHKTNGGGPNGADFNGNGSARYWGASADGSKVFFTSEEELTDDANTGVSDRQEIAVRASGGTYTLAFKDQTTVPISYTASPAEVQSALEALSSVGVGNVAVSAVGHSVNVASAFLVTFDGALAGSEQPAMTADSSSLSEEGTVNITDFPRPGNDLYEYDLESGKLTDLTADTADANGAAVQGVVQISEDGAYVYFVADGDLGGDARSGAPNLYVSHDGGAPALIATLTASDELDWHGSSEEDQSSPESNSAVVAPDGTRLAFMSDGELTGYDNHDANTGEPDDEVYLYDAETNGLVCASCNPSGARPIGPSSLGRSEIGSLEEYRSRHLVEDGTLFFDSSDALVPHASDGRENVYEYEDGHIYPISDVAGSYESFFLDASANGENVFFATVDQLLPQDTSQNVVVYDARVGGGFPVTVASSACTNADACKPPQTPQPAVFGAPASATFSGVGNAILPSSGSSKKTTSRTARCVKGKKLSHGKCIKKPRPKKRKASKSTDRKGSR